MAKDTKTRDKELKDLTKRIETVRAKLEKAIEKVFPGSKASMMLQIKINGKALQMVTSWIKSIDDAIKDYLLKKGVPKDTIAKMLPEYKAKYRKSVEPVAIELQNLFKDYQELKEGQ